MRRLVLASTSRYRRELLARLTVPFEVRAPDVDESRLPGETPTDMVLRLARRKAEAVGKLVEDALILKLDILNAIPGKDAPH